MEITELEHCRFWWQCGDSAGGKYTDAIILDWGQVTRKLLIKRNTGIPNVLAISSRIDVAPNSHTVYKETQCKYFFVVLIVE